MKEFQSIGIIIDRYNFYSKAFWEYIFQSCHSEFMDWQSFDFDNFSPSFRNPRCPPECHRLKFYSIILTGEKFSTL